MELVGVYYTLLDTEEGGAEDWTLTCDWQVVWWCFN